MGELFRNSDGDRINESLESTEEGLPGAFETTGWVPLKATMVRERCTETAF